MNSLCRSRLNQFLLMLLAFLFSACAASIQGLEEKHIVPTAALNDVVTCAMGAGLSKESAAELGVELDSARSSGFAKFATLSTEKVETNLIEKFSADDTRLAAFELYVLCIIKRNDQLAESAALKTANDHLKCERNYNLTTAKVLEVYGHFANKSSNDIHFSEEDVRNFLSVSEQVGKQPLCTNGVGIRAILQQDHMAVLNLMAGWVEYKYFDNAARARASLADAEMHLEKAESLLAAADAPVTSEWNRVKNGGLMFKFRRVEVYAIRSALGDPSYRERAIELIKTVPCDYRDAQGFSKLQTLALLGIPELLHCD